MLWGAVFSYRKACWQKLSQESPRLKPRTTTVYTVWNLSTLAAALDRRDAGIFLDIYKECNYRGLLKSPGQTRAPPATGAFLRLGVIGAARGLLISTRCYWRDEQEYDGLIDVRESSSARCCLRDPMVSCVAWPVAWPVARTLTLALSCYCQTLAALSALVSSRRRALPWFIGHSPPHTLPTHRPLIASPSPHLTILVCRAVRRLGSDRGKILGARKQECSGARGLGGGAIPTNRQTIRAGAIL